MSDPQSESLSSHGRARREVMLEELIQAMDRTHRRRRARRRLLAGAGCVCLALVLVRLLLPVPSGPRYEHQSAGLSGGHAVSTAGDQDRRGYTVIADIVQTDPAVLERCRARPTGSVLRIDDQILLTTLASINRPAGLIRIGGQVRLSAPVTDAELEINQ